MYIHNVTGLQILAPTSPLTLGSGLTVQLQSKLEKHQLKRAFLIRSIQRTKTIKNRKDTEYRSERTHSDWKLVKSHYQLIKKCTYRRFYRTAIVLNIDRGKHFIYINCTFTHCKTRISELNRTYDTLFIHNMLRSMLLNTNKVKIRCI